jgi:SAM-dependent methyltransferase
VQEYGRLPSIQEAERFTMTLRTVCVTQARKRVISAFWGRPLGEAAAPLLLILRQAFDSPCDSMVNRLHTVAMFTTHLARLSLAVGVLWLALTPFGLPPAAIAENSVAKPDYRQGRGSPDGIGKFYRGREIAAVMGFEGTPWLERPSRASEERPDLLVMELHLQPGMNVADIGAGSGYLSRRLAPLVGTGRVFAVDVQPEMVALLTEWSRKPEFMNLVPIQADPDDVKLPPASIDLAVLVDVYHELAFPYEVMISLVRALKPGGRVVLVEYRGEDAAVPIKPLHKMSTVQIRREMTALPLTWERTSERLPMQHIVVFRKSPIAE